MSPEKKYLTWKQFDKDINSFIDYLNYAGIHIHQENTIILGLKRGGLPSAVALSNRLDLPISLVTFQTRDGNDNEPKFLEPEMINSKSNIIIVDDIYDTGLTVECIVSKLVDEFGVSIDNVMGLFHYYTDNIKKTKLGNIKCIHENHGSWITFAWE